MTIERPTNAGPTWRKPSREPFEEERTLVVCRCGVDMQFHWPRGQEVVRCFGCGARFTRPPHLPATTIPPWIPPRPKTGLERLRAGLTRAQLIVFGLCVVAAALLGIGVGFLLTAR